MFFILDKAWHGELSQRRSYRSRGRWSQSKAQEGPSQNQDEYLCLHWMSHVSSLNNPKDMFDAMKNMYADELENSNQGCEGAMSKNIQWLLHKNMSSQGEIRIHWRQCKRSKSINYNIEWSSKFSQKSCYNRKITYGWVHDWLMEK